jgi:hypothetical protein
MKRIRKNLVDKKTPPLSREGERRTGKIVRSKKRHQM